MLDLTTVDGISIELRKGNWCSERHGRANIRMEGRDLVIDIIRAMKREFEV